uniref:Uncharacterized protein n=1 Tax=Oryza sativa subsp. japonica TaxID=39947 RepID=Q8H8I5_ORYSJ|nr:hypothetical protein [Oryza sativa Japonica Group]
MVGVPSHAPASTASRAISRHAASTTESRCATSAAREGATAGAAYLRQRVCRPRELSRSTGFFTFGPAAGPSAAGHAVSVTLPPPASAGSSLGQAKSGNSSRRSASLEGGLTRRHTLPPAFAASPVPERKRHRRRRPRRRPPSSPAGFPAVSSGGGEMREGWREGAATLGFAPRVACAWAMQGSPPIRSTPGLDDMHVW